MAWQVGAAWSVAGSDELRLAFKDRPLDHGVSLVATGVLPLAAHRADGWSLTYTGLPVTLDPAAFPPWLIDAFGGRWTA